MLIDPLKPSPQLIVLALFFLALVGAIGVTWLAALVRFLNRQPLLPDRPLKIVPWGFGSIVMLLVLWLGVQFGVLGVFLSARRAAQPAQPVAAEKDDAGDKNGGRFSARDQVWMMAAISLVLVPLVPMTLRVTSRARREDLGLGRFRLSDAAFGVMGCLIILPVTSVLMILLSRFMKATPHQLMEALKSDSSGTMALLALFSAVVAAPLLEEMLFRGVLFGWLTKLAEPRPVAASVSSPPLPDESAAPVIPPPDDPTNPYLAPDPSLENPYAEQEVPPFEASRLSGWGTLSGLPFAWAMPNVVTSLIFAGLHFQQWPAPIALFPLSLLLGYLYKRTGSLFTSIAMHATFNGINMAFLLLAIWSGAPIGPQPAKPPALKPIPAVVGQMDTNLKGFWIFGEDFPCEEGVDG
jgi:membrane protease YdiL (CAAX protease family)